MKTLFISGITKVVGQSDGYVQISFTWLFSIDGKEYKIESVGGAHVSDDGGQFRGDGGNPVGQAAKAIELRATRKVKDFAKDLKELEKATDMKKHFPDSDNSSEEIMKELFEKTYKLVSGTEEAAEKVLLDAGEDVLIDILEDVGEVLLAFLL